MTHYCAAVTPTAAPWGESTVGGEIEGSGRHVYLGRSQLAIGEWKGKMLSNRSGITLELCQRPEGATTLPPRTPRPANTTHPRPDPHYATHDYAGTPWNLEV